VTTVNSTALATTKVAGSVGATPNNSALIDYASANAPATPTAIPAIAIVRP
jgi:hypothetical protein